MKTKLPSRIACDLLVIGSGASGLSAAVTAAHHGLKVVLVEKDPVFGGATAWSGGNAIPDVHGKVPGAGTQGHQVAAAPCDGREVGPLIKRLRKTMRETSFIGMPIMAGADLAAFLSMTRSFKSLLHVTKRFCRHLIESAPARRLMLENGAGGVQSLAPLSPPSAARSRFARPRAWCWPQAASRTTCSGARRCSRARRRVRSIWPCRRRAVPATASRWANRPAVRW